MPIHNGIGSSLCTEQELQIIAEVIHNRNKTFLICVTNFFRKKCSLYCNWLFVVKWPELNLDVIDPRHLPGCCMWWVFTAGRPLCLWFFSSVPPSMSRILVLVNAFITSKLPAWSSDTSTLFFLVQTIFFVLFWTKLKILPLWSWKLLNLSLNLLL